MILQKIENTYSRPVSIFKKQISRDQVFEMTFVC